MDSPTAQPSVVSNPPLGRPLLVWSVWAAVVCIAVYVRVSGLENCPAGFFRDEAEKGYNAFALATSGGVIEIPVEQGRAGEIRWRARPVLIDVFGVKTSAIYQYASAPLVAMMGLSAGSVRMAAALAGAATIALLGIVFIRIWPPGAALAAAVWLALCPWHYLFSRWAAQGIFVPLGMAAALAGLEGAERGRRWGFGLAGAALGFIFYAYSGAQPFVLAWGGALAVLYRGRIKADPRGALVGAALFAALAAPRAWIIAFGGGGGRLEAVALWSAEDANFLNTTGRFIGNYIAHFSPGFLFFEGDSLARHSIPGFGQMLLLDVVFMPLGIWATYRRRMALRGALAAAFLCGPLGAAITRIGIPHALRSLPMVLPAAVWGGVGLWVVAQWVHERIRQSSGQVFGEAATRLRARTFTTIVVTLSLLWGARVYQAYRRAYREDAGALAAFAQSERRSFEELFEQRRAGQRVWIDGFIAYGPYLALYYGSLPARASAQEGLEKQGFLFFPQGPEARERVLERMAPGDWIVSLERGSGEVFLVQK